MCGTARGPVRCRTGRDAAAAGLASAGDVSGRLHERYALLEEYEERMRKNFTDNFVEFFDALWAKRKQ